MPLTAIGKEIMQHMKQLYGEKKGESVFYSKENAGTLTPKAFTKGGKKRQKRGKRRKK